MEIAFNIKNKMFRERLIERFIEYEPYNILNESISESYDILVTDEIVLGDEREVVCNYDLSAKEIFTICKNRFDTNSKDSVYKDIKIFSFYGFYGGSGVTSIALTFSRLLSMNNHKVIFISLGNFNSTSLYFRDRDSFTLKMRKVEYLLQQNTIENLFDNLFYDQFNVGVLNVSKAKYIEDILKMRSDSTYYVIDSGTKKLDLSKNEFLILNDEDERSKFIDCSNNIIVNKASNLTKDGNNIPNDRKSFRSNNERIEILLDGAFKKAIFRIIESVCDGRGN